MGQFEVSNITHVDPTKVTLLACHNRLESSCQHYELDCALSLNIGKSNGLVRLQQQAIQVLWACRPCYPPIKVQTHSFVGEKVVLNHLLVGGPFPNILIALEWLSKHVSNCSAKALWWCSGRFVDFSSTTCAEEIPCDPKDVNTWKSFTRSSSCIVCAMDKSSLLCDWSVVKWTSAGLWKVLYDDRSSQTHLNRRTDIESLPIGPWKKAVMTASSITARPTITMMARQNEV